MEMEIDLARITEMENALNQTDALIQEMENLLKKWEENLPNNQKLYSYYYSEEWRKDFEAANENKLPPRFPHGVLSEDAAYNTLGDFRELSLRMLKIGVKGVE